MHTHTHPRAPITLTEAHTHTHVCVPVTACVRQCAVMPTDALTRFAADFGVTALLPSPVST